MISPDAVFLLIAGLAFLGFVLDALFDRIRVTSVLPLMLLGIALVYFHVLPADTLHGLNALVPFISALTIAFILFHVGLGIRFEDLSKVLGRTLAYTMVVQVTTGVALSLLAWSAFHWGVLISFVFGFALSGPSSISVPVLVRVARMPEELRTSLLFESVITDLLQLLVPLILLGLLVSGNFSTLHIGGVLTLTLVGSAVAGIVAAVLWLWVLERIASIAKEYTWTLTITMVLATYGISDYLGLSAAITIFVFGLMIGNRKHLEFDPFAKRAPDRTAAGRSMTALRRALRLTVEGLDVEHIQQVQKEVSFFASAFFFVYIGFLFQFGGLSLPIVAVPLLAAFAMLAVRFVFSPILAVYFSSEPSAHRSERGLLTFNIPRGLAAAIIATVPLADGLVIPGFLDTMFLGILFSTLVSTIGIYFLYSPAATPPTPPPPWWEIPPSSASEPVAIPMAQSLEPAKERSSVPPPLPKGRQTPPAR